MNAAELDKEVKRLVNLNWYQQGYVCAVDVLRQLGVLKEKDYEDWRFGRVEYLEKVCGANLSRLTLISKLKRKHARGLAMKGSLAVYNKYGKGPDAG